MACPNPTQRKYGVDKPGACLVMKARTEATARAARAEREAMRDILEPLGLIPGTDAARAALSKLPKTDVMAQVLAGDGAS